MKAWHVLVLDPDPTRRDLLVQLLRREGHQPVVVQDAAAAARALDVPGLDLLLLDLSLPGLDPTAVRRLLAPGEPAQPDTLEAAERRHIDTALRYTKGNKRRTAHLLGIARSTLLAKVRRYRLDTPPENGKTSADT